VELPPVEVRAIRVFLMEPHVLIAKALCRSFASDLSISVTGESAFFDEEALTQSMPDVVLVDFDNDLAAVDEVIAGCRRVVPTAHVCVLSGSMAPDVMTHVLSAGANGYVVKDVTPDQLIACIKRIVTEGFYADERLSSHVLQHSLRGTLATLTQRELEVAKLIAQGLSNQEIGDRLLLSSNTVKNHVANIFSKLNLTARTQLAIYAIKRGWV